MIPPNLGQLNREETEDIKNRASKNKGIAYDGISDIILKECPWTFISNL